MDMQQFRIEVASNGQGYFFDIKSIGNQQYEIYKAQQKVGTIEIDYKDHEHCRGIDCEMDMPLLNAIREGIVLHQQLSS